MELHDLYAALSICLFVSTCILCIIGIFSEILHTNRILKSDRICRSSIDSCIILCFLWILCVIGFYVTEKTEEKQIISNDIEMKLTVTGYNRDNKAMMCSHLSIEQTMAQNPKLLHEKLSNLKQLHKFDYCHYQIMEYGEIIETGYDFISPREESEV